MLNKISRRNLECRKLHNKILVKLILMIGRIRKILKRVIRKNLVKKVYRKEILRIEIRTQRMSMYKLNLTCLLRSKMLKELILNNDQRKE